jgi:putative flavoprotein involved in K+ transport
MASLLSDCVVVGAGPAGLAVSAALADHGVEHVVLERDRVAETWRTQRWDSFRLNTPPRAWIHRRSAFLFGFPDDAETIANGVKMHLTQRSRR